jgi:hypothetical protein
MARNGLADLCPDVLYRLVEGMTIDEVAAIVGPFHRPNLYEGQRHYAWMGKGGMLRAFFSEPGGTLSGAVLSVAEADRTLDLRGDARHRRKNCTVVRRWACVPCRKVYRRSVIPTYVCPICGAACEHTYLGIRVPQPSRARVWDDFWVRYKAERLILDAYELRKLRMDVKLEVFGIRLKANAETKRERR